MLIESKLDFRLTSEDRDDLIAFCKELRMKKRRCWGSTEGKATLIQFTRHEAKLQIIIRGTTATILCLEPDDRVVRVTYARLLERLFEYE